ncbi:MAG: DoxX family protein [Candidatus Liptonbacteria bacterium]|nr:DoxX family protein [Candidatus Liptonbacteria bacterium]
MFDFSFYYGDWALALLRIILGILLVVHGLPKLKDLKATSAGFDSMGFKPGAFWGPLVAFAEFFGGLALVLGIGTEFAAAVFVIQFAVITIWKIISRQPFAGGFEIDLLILGAAAILLTQGAGVFSVDKFFYGGF